MTPKTQRIAIIGLSTRYAGGVYTPEQLWANLKAGVDPISDFPTGRWDRGYLNPDHDIKGRSYIYAGGYLDSVDTFDAEFFGISPREAQQIDPQQRLTLELAWEALEHAGVVPANIAGSATGVFVGLSSRDYADFFDDAGIDAYTNLGLSLSIASNRISYVLDLKGPSMTIDTACSSGMVALHQAVQALQRGDCSMALAGAANLVLSPKAFVGFSKASMLSPKGRCTTFDADGAGYVRAEGGGMLLLKPLEDAERDGDNILGVIIASGVNSDGRTMGIALPSAEAQAALLRQVYGQAGVSADQVYYVEAHGTGTAVGDPIECSAIASVLGGANRGDVPLRVGSIKSNVGHLEPAAGIAGLTKVLLSIQHRELPAQLHFNTPNPKIDFAAWKLDVVAKPHPLPDTPEPLIFGVNSFGFGGTNAHAVVQEYRPSAKAGAATTQPSTSTASQADAGPATPWRDVLLLSAQSAAALTAMAQAWQPLLQAEVAASQANPAEAAARWEALRANALHHRSHHAHRLALHAGNADEALARLNEYLAEHQSEADSPAPRAGPEVAVGKAPASGLAKVAWVYAGNGPQWWGMGRELMAADATYRSAVEGVDAIFKRLSGWSLITELMRDAETSRMALTEVAQPTLFALQVGLTTVLRAAGLQPDAVIGHRVGEAAAAWASGALSLEQATLVIHQRSLAQAATAGLGRMAALGVSASEAQAAIDRINGQGGFLEVAAINSPSAVTVAGDPAQLEALCQHFVDAGKFARVLTLDYPFHTRAMDGIRDGLARGLDGLAPGASTVPFVSTVDGKVLDGGALGADYWWHNVREPVAFQAGVVHLLDEMKVGGFIEIGPHPVLRDYLLQNAKARAAQATVLTTLRRPRGDVAEPEVALLRQTVCAAYANGLGQPTRLAAAPARRVQLPAYPWQRVRHWRGEHALPDQRPPTHRDHPLLGWRLSPGGSVWENHPDLFLLPYLADHVIQDSIVFPGAGYVEQALAAGRQLFGDGPTQLEGVEFLKPMVLSPQETPVLQCKVDAADGTFEIHSRPMARLPDSTLHVRGRITQAEPSHRPPAIDIPSLWHSLPVALDGAAHYAGCVARGMHYGPGFQGVDELRLSDAEDERRLVAGWINLPDLGHDAHHEGLDAYRSHPAILDGCLQVIVSLMGQFEQRRCSYIPVRVDRLRWFAPLTRRVFCEARLVRDSHRSGSAEIIVRNEAGECLMVLDSTRFQKVDFNSSKEPMRLADRWRLDAKSGAAAASPAGHAIALPAPQAVVSVADLQAAALPLDAELAARFDRLAGAYAVQALRSLQVSAGLDAAASFTAAALPRRAKVLPEMLPLYRALVEMAVADGALQTVDAGLAWSGQAAEPASQQWAALMQAAPGHSAELQLLAQVGERLHALLLGQATPATPLVAERAHPAFETLLDGAPFSAAGHAAAARALRALAACWPADRALRVLELHAGLGGFTATALAALPDLRCDYAASDRDPAVVERLAQRYKTAAPLRGVTVDLADEASLAALQGQFDLLLCADGLAAAGLTPDVALQRAAGLVADGGWLLLLATRPQRLATLVLGQDPAWWRQDSAPLLGDEVWSGLLPASGWQDPLCAATGAQSLLLARKPLATIDTATAAASAAVAPAADPASATAQDWLLLADTSPAGSAFAAGLATALQQRGQRTRTLVLHAGDAASAPAGSQAVDDAAALSAALAGHMAPPLDRIVHLAGLTGGDDLTQPGRHDSNPLATQPLRCMPLIALSQTQQRDDAASLAKPRLVVLARGATLGPDAGPAMDPAQAPVWGLARVLSNEHADLMPKLVDLHATLDEGLAQRLADELLRDDGETEVLLDDSGRWLARLEAHSIPQIVSAAASLPGRATDANATAEASNPTDAHTAVRLMAAQQGGLDALKLQAVPRRAPGEGEVELAVRAAGLNFRDVLWAMNMLPEEAVEHGFSGATIGMECAAEVVAVGEGVDNVAVGDRVIGFASGCFASHVTTSAGAVARIPANLGWAEAATLPTAFLTAQYALIHLARLEPGERVLIHGAAGGVGLAAVQIAKLRGAVVFGTAGNDEKRRLLRLVGVDHVLDSRSLAFADDVLALTNGQGVDVVLNSLAGEAITKNLQILRPFGRFCEIGKRDFYANSRIGLKPFSRNLSYFGIDADTLLIERPDLARKVFAEVAALVAAGSLHPLPYQALPIARASRAFRLMQQSRHVGKIVVTLPAADALADADADADASAPALKPLADEWTARPDGTYLVTGGLGGFGLATASWMVARGARHMALVSRSGAASDEAKAGIAAMQAMGATVRAFAADVGDGQQVANVLNEVRASMPPLRGVLHSAMVLDDAPMLLLNQQRLMAVLKPKIDGAWHLHQQTLGDPLDSFVLYSSATTVVGNPGQGNYVAGNIYLQALAQWRRARGLPALSIAWGAIRDVGVVTRTAGLANLLEKRSGIAATDSDQALAELGRMMASGAVAVSVAPFNVQRLAEMLQVAMAPRFRPLAPEGAEAGGAARETLAERWASTPADARRPIVVDVLRDHLARILGTASAQVDIERPLSDMGLDSLMAVELATSLEREVGRPVSVMQMIQATSAAAVADTLIASLEPAAHA